MFRDHSPSVYQHPYERGLEDLEDEEDDVDDPLGTVEVLLDRSLQIRSVKNATLLLTADCTSGSGGAAVADDALSQNSSKVGEGKFFLNKNSTQEIHMFSNISSLISSFSINVLEVIFHRVFTFDGTILPLALALEDVSPFQIPVRPFKLSFREVWCLSHATLSKSKPHVDFYVSSFLH